GRGVVCDSSSPILTNCILWDNAGGAIGKEESSNPIVSYSCIEGGWSGDANIQIDPQFCGWDTAERFGRTPADRVPARALNRTRIRARTLRSATSGTA